MKKKYVTPQISVIETIPVVLQAWSLGGGQPGNGGVVPQSLDWEEDY